MKFKKYIYVLCAGHFFNDIGMGILPATLPFFIALYGMSYADVSGLIFAASFLSSIIQPISGWIADKVSKAWIMSIGIFLSGVAMGSIGLFKNYWLIFIAVTISGIGNAIFHPEAARMVNKLSDSVHKGTALSIFSMGGNAGMAFGPIIVVILITIFGIKGTVAFSILAFLMSAILFFVLPQLQKDLEANKTISQQQEKESISVTGTNHWLPFLRLTIVIACSSLVVCGLRSFIPLYLVAYTGLSDGAASSALSLLFIFGIVMTLIGGVMADKFGYLRIVQISYTILVPMIFILTHTQSPLLSYLLMIPIGFATFAPYSSIVVLGQNYLARNIGFASGVTMGLYFSIGGIFIPLMGKFADIYGLTAVMQLLTFFALIAALASFILKTPFK